MYWRRFPISSIPLDNTKAFDLWLRARWTEKDNLIEEYLRTGRFPADKGVSKTSDGKTRRGAGYITTEIKPTNWYEFLQVFAPVGLFALVLYMFYGALPKKYSKSINQAALVNKILSLSNNQIGESETKNLTGLAQHAIGNNLTELKKAALTQKESVTALENQDLIKRVLSIQKSGVQGPETKQLMGLLKKYIHADVNALSNVATKQTSTVERLDRQTLLNKIVSIQKNGIQGPESKQLMDLAQKYMGSEITGLNELLAKQKKPTSDASTSKTSASKVNSQKPNIKPTPNQKSKAITKTPPKASSTISASQKAPSVGAAKDKPTSNTIKNPPQKKPISKPTPTKTSPPANSLPKTPNPKPKKTPPTNKISSKPTPTPSKPALKKPNSSPTPRKPHKKLNS